MVFSRSCCRRGKWGQAVVIPCSNRLQTPQSLIEEAKNLWRAEQPEDAASSLDLGSPWGRVALLENPNARIPSDWLNQWKRTVDNDRKPPDRVNCAKGEGPAVDREGMLQIPWPQSVDGVDLLGWVDALLATATNPTIDHGKYADAKAIARAWNSVDPKWCEYFWQNRKNGIHTFQDSEIEQLLDDRHRCP
jgi:hypothetical protein